MRNSRAAAIVLIILFLFMAFPSCKAPETADTSTISVSAAASKTIAAEGSVDITLYRFTLENSEHGLSYVSGYIAEGGSFTANGVPGGEWTAKGEAYIGTSDAPVRVAESKAVSFTVNPGSTADVHIPFDTLLDIDAESIAITLVLPEYLQAEGTVFNASYRITDMAGSMKAEGSASGTAAADGTYILSIDPANLGQGSYLVSVTVLGGGEERTAVEVMRLIGRLPVSGTLYFDTWTPEALPEPDISVARLSATSGRITIHNWNEYPADTVAVVNGVEYPLAETIDIVIGEDEAAISVHMAYKGEEHYAEESTGSEGTIPEYVPPKPKCATPTISQSGNTVTFTCSTSGATIHYSGCGVSGTCSSGGSVTITESGTMTAYATRNGYTASYTASKSCIMALPTPIISVDYRYATDDNGVSGTFRVSNENSFPIGTTFNYRYTGPYTLGVKTGSFGIGGYIRFNFEGITNNSWRFNDLTITASCDGYQSSTGKY